MGIRSGYQQLAYQVVDTIEEVEIRHYQSRVVAEATVMKDRNEAFMSLFRYISGANTVQQKIDMTTPVQVEEQRAKLAMTSPVQISETSEESVSMRFFLPEGVDVQNAPVPTDKRISIKTLPEETVAGLRYTGSSGREKFIRMRESLLRTLSNSNWETTGEPSFLGYDPPFTIFFLKRNEVIVAVKKKS